MTPLSPALDRTSHPGLAGLPAPNAELLLPVFAGTAPVGDELHEIACTSDEAGDRLVVVGVCEAQINASGERVIVNGDQHPLSPDRIATVVCGPVLTLALARQGIVCLHASAVLTDRGTLLLVGESGAGKSTLARHLATLPGVVRVTDDVTPLATDTAAPAVLPHFPQLKLPLSAQWPTEAPPRLSVAGICLLHGEPPCARQPLEPVALGRTGRGGASEPGESGEGSRGVAVRPVSKAASVARLLHHVVGLPLFRSELRQRALESCAALVRTAPVFELLYPHQPDSLARVASLLAQAELLQHARPEETGREPIAEATGRPPSWAPGASAGEVAGFPCGPLDRPVPPDREARGMDP